MSFQVFEKHPDMDAYRVGGSFVPYAVAWKYKRFTDAELAAEYHNMDSDCQVAWIDGEHTPAMQERFETLERFATLPHFDEATA